MPTFLSFLIDDTVTCTTGWSVSSLYLTNGIISLLWGLALVIFSLGIVPVDWVISQYGKNHSEIINALVTLIATASTTMSNIPSKGSWTIIRTMC